MRANQSSIICDQCKKYYPAGKIMKHKGYYLCEKCLTDDINNDNIKNRKIGLIEKIKSLFK